MNRKPRYPNNLLWPVGRIKYVYLIMMVVILVSIILSIRYQDKDYERRMAKYRRPALEDKLNIVISSAYWDNRWYLINDSLGFNALHIPYDSTWLSDYLLKGDILIKKENNDTIYVMRNQNLQKFIIVRG